MPFTLTCTCGAHLVIDDKFGGQVVHCPDCHRPVTVVGKVWRTNGLALSSFLLALVGAFTLLGTLLAMVAGYWALRRIKQNPHRFAGRHLAWSGIFLGALFTGLGSFLFFGSDFLGLQGWLRHLEWSARLNFSGDLKHSFPVKRFSITRPNQAWGILEHLEDKNRVVQKKSEAADDLILVWPRADAHISITHFYLEGPDQSRELVRDLALEKLRGSELAGLLLGPKGKLPRSEKVSPSQFPPHGAFSEMQVDITLGRHERTFLLRVFKGGTQFFLVAGGTRKNCFDQLQGELRKALDSFKIER